jgi:Plasmid protein of unknown function (Plasmid_RAQPRD)
VARVFLSCLASLTVAVSCAGLSPRASAQPTSPATAPAVDAAEAGRVYLSQSLAALQWARRYAETAARSGQPEGFDVDRYLAELDTVAHGLERYLRPEGPAPGSLTPVEITGQFLLEGLRGPGPRPSGEPQP